MRLVCRRLERKQGWITKGFEGRSNDFGLTLQRGKPLKNSKEGSDVKKLIVSEMTSCILLLQESGMIY